MLAHLDKGCVIEQDVVVRSLALDAFGHVNGVANGGVVLHTP